MTEAKNTFAEIPVEQILPNPDQPRRMFEDDSLASLAASIAWHGVLQPVTVRGPIKLEAGTEIYYLIAGERRWRASILVGKKTIPAYIRNNSDGEEQSLELAITENMQREDMSPLEEGLAYKRLRDEGIYVRRDL